MDFYKYVDTSGLSGSKNKQIKTRNLNKKLSMQIWITLW